MFSVTGLPSYYELDHTPKPPEYSSIYPVNEEIETPNQDQPPGQNNLYEGVNIRSNSGVIGNASVLGVVEEYVRQRSQESEQNLTHGQRHGNIHPVNRNLSTGSQQISANVRSNSLPPPPPYSPLRNSYNRPRSLSPVAHILARPQRSPNRDTSVQVTSPRTIPMQRSPNRQVQNQNRIPRRNQEETANRARRSGQPISSPRGNTNRSREPGSDQGHGNTVSHGRGRSHLQTEQEQNRARPNQDTSATNVITQSSNRIQSNRQIPKGDNSNVQSRRPMVFGSQRSGSDGNCGEEQNVASSRPEQIRIRLQDNAGTNRESEL